MKFRVITGFYPSAKTAERIALKIRGSFPRAYWYKEGTFYVVVISCHNDFVSANMARQYAIEKKIPCGVEAVIE